MNAQQALIKQIESTFCPNSTDAGGTPANHYIREGACVICDRSVWGLSILHDLA